MIQRILELAQENGLKQTDLANLIGCSTGNISDWKKGKVRPSVDYLVKIADHFNVSVDYLIGRTDIRNTDYMIDVYNTGVIRWINDRAFNDDQKAAIKDNFFEALVRYKEIVNKYANYMYSDRRKELIKNSAPMDTVCMASCSAISDQLRDMILWIAAFPADADKAYSHQNADLNGLRRKLAEMLGVQHDGKLVNLSQDEKDLLSIWELLDREGRQVLLGTAFIQKQRVDTEKKIANDETA